MKLLEKQVTLGEMEFKVATNRDIAIKTFEQFPDLMEYLISQKGQENSNEEVVDISLKQTFVTNLFVALLTIICVFTLSAMGAVEFIAAIYALLAVLIVLYSQHFVVCPLWAKLIKKDGFSVYSKAIKLSNENKEQEEVEIITE